jgi:hypothetical protein
MCLQQILLTWIQGQHWTWVRRNYMNNKRNIIFAWILFGLITAAVIGAVFYDVKMNSSRYQYSPFDYIAPLVPLAFAFVGALIISKQPRNSIGLLMMLPGLSFFILVDAILRPYISAPPESPTPAFLLILWFSNWNWLLLVFPLMFIMVLFPTGRPLSPRWGWLIYYGLVLGGVILLLSIASESLTIGSGASWVLENPVGFMSNDLIDTYISTPFFLSLPVWVILCVASLLVRFRYAQDSERQQIKWLIYAASIFAVSYIPTFIRSDFSDADNIWNIFWMFGMFAIPAGIAIAILRYRLYDIDIIIRRTLQYTLLTGLLVMVYFSSVVLLQGLVENLTGEQSPIVIVISTLGIAALFNPLRHRIQDFIDRRFYRKKFDAAQTLARFASLARNEVEIENITAALLNMVEESLQPEKVSGWLRNSEVRE